MINWRLHDLIWIEIELTLWLRKLMVVWKWDGVMVFLLRDVVLSLIFNIRCLGIFSSFLVYWLDIDGNNQLSFITVSIRLSLKNHWTLFCQKLCHCPTSSQKECQFVFDVNGYLSNYGFQLISRHYEWKFEYTARSGSNRNRWITEVLHWSIRKVSAESTEHRFFCVTSYSKALVFPIQYWRQSRKKKIQ